MGVWIFAVFFLSQTFSTCGKWKRTSTNQRSASEEWLFPSSKIRIAYISAYEWVFVLSQFLLQKIWRIYWSWAHCPANTNLNLTRSTYNSSFLAIESPAFLLILILSVWSSATTWRLVLQSLALMLLRLLWTSKIQKSGQIKAAWAWD